METIDNPLRQQVEKIRSTGQQSTTRKLVDLREEAQRFAAAFRKAEPRFDVKKADRNILNSVFAWVWRADYCNTLKLDYNKGLCLLGNLGLGKSLTLKALQQYMNSLKARGFEDSRLGMWWKSASELANIYAVGGQPSLISYAEDNLCIDELGREPIPANSYGTKMNVITFLLQLRYDKRRDFVTHITANLAISDIASYYGDYVADRSLEMFNFINFTGESLRY